MSLYIEGQERLCLAQISNTLLKPFSYNEIHNRRVALGITCVQCTPVQLEILRRAGAMPVSSRRCGMITRREAERLCKSFLGDNAPPRLPDDFSFSVQHKCAWGCKGAFVPARYNSSRAKCIKCYLCGMFFSPNKFIFHSHQTTSLDKYVQPDAANFNSWRRHMFLSGNPDEETIHAWEDVKAMFNGGTRKRLTTNSNSCSTTLSLIKRDDNDNRKSMLEPSSNSFLKSHIDIKLSKKAKSVSNKSSESFTTSVVGLSSAVTTVRPIALHQQVSNEKNGSNQQGPVQRNFMIDYLWQTQQHNNNIFPFSNTTFPSWIKENYVQRSTSNGILLLNNSSETCSSVNREELSSALIKNSSSSINDLDEDKILIMNKDKPEKDNEEKHNQSITQFITVPQLLKTSAFKPFNESKTKTPDSSVEQCEKNSSVSTTIPTTSAINEGNFFFICVNISRH